MVFPITSALMLTLSWDVAIAMTLTSNSETLGNYGATISYIYILPIR